MKGNWHGGILRRFVTQNVAPCFWHYGLRILFNSGEKSGNFASIFIYKVNFAKEFLKNDKYFSRNKIFYCVNNGGSKLK